MTRACRRSTYDKPHHCYPCLPRASTTILRRRSNFAHSNGVLIAFSPRVHNNRRPFSLTVRRAPKRRGEKRWELRSQVAMVVERPSFDDVYTTTPVRLPRCTNTAPLSFRCIRHLQELPSGEERTEIRVLRPHRRTLYHSTKTSTGSPTTSSVPCSHFSPARQGHPFSARVPQRTAAESRSRLRRTTRPRPPPLLLSPASTRSEKLRTMTRGLKYKSWSSSSEVLLSTTPLNPLVPLPRRTKPA